MLSKNLMKKLSKYAYHEKVARRWLGDDVLEKLSSKLTVREHSKSKKKSPRCSGE